MKVGICIPCGETLEEGFVKSLLALKRDCFEESDVFFEAGSLVYVARENLMKKALAERCDYLLWLDSDMTFEPDLLEKLYADKKDMVCGLFFRRKPPYNTCIYSKLRTGLTASESEHELIEDYPKNSLFEVEGMGFGAVLMKAEVCESVLGRFNVGFVPMGGYGEDLSFCLRARHKGYHLWCDSRIKVGHIARTIVNEDTYKALQKTKYYDKK